MKRPTECLCFLTAVVIAVGCQSENERLAEFAQSSVQQQAAQNQEMARLNKDVATALQSVSGDQLESRQEYTELLRQIQTQQNVLAANATALADERRRIEQARRRDSVLAPICTTIGAALVCLLPLLVTWRLLAFPDVSQATDADLTELLANELASDRPVLLPASSSLEGSGKQRLLAETSDDDSPNDR